MAKSVPDFAKIVSKHVAFPGRQKPSVGFAHEVVNVLRSPGLRAARPALCVGNYFYRAFERFRSEQRRILVTRITTVECLLNINVDVLPDEDPQPDPRRVWQCFAQ